MGITYPKPGSPSVSVTGGGTDPRNQVAAYGTAAEWAAASPVLAVGELGYETDTYVYKVGDGATAWASLTTAGGGTYVRTCGLSNGTDDTAAIQALLTAARTNGAGRVTGLPGQTYYLSAPLVIGSATTLDMTGCVVTLKNGSVVNLLNNYAFGNATTVQDGAMTSASATLACATSTPFSGSYATIGTPVMVWGAGPKGAPLATTISAVTNSGSITLADAASVSVSATPVSIGTRDHDITVIGGIWRTGGQRGSTPATGDIIRMRRCDRVVIREVTVDDTGFHAICFGDATDYAVQDFRMAIAPPIQMDGIHLHGPLDGGVITNVQGYGASALVSVTPNDYVGSNDVYGPVTNLDVIGVHAEPHNTGVQVAVCGGSTASGSFARGIRIANVSGPSASSNGVVCIQDDTGSANTTGGFMTDIHVENVKGRVNNSNSCLVGITGTNTGQVRISRLHAAGSAETYAVGLVWVKSTAVVAGLAVEDVTINTLSSSSAAVRVDGAVTQLSIDKVRADASMTYALQVHGSAANITRALVSNLLLSAGSPVQVDSSSATFPKLDLVNVQGVGGYAIGDIATSTEVHAVNVNSAPSVNIMNIGAAAAVITLYATNCSFNAKTLQGTAGGKVRSKGSGFPIDTTSSFLQSNAGDLAYHTNASVTPFVVGPVVSDGTAWRSLQNGGAIKTGTATLSGGTIAVSDTSITANSVIRLGYKTIGGTPGAVYVSARSASTSFTITSTSGSDTSVVQYWIDAY